MREGLKAHRKPQRGKIVARVAAYLVPSQPCSDRSIVTPSGPVNFTSTLPRFAISSVPGQGRCTAPAFSILLFQLFPSQVLAKLSRL